MMIWKGKQTEPNGDTLYKVIVNDAEKGPVSLALTINEIRNLRTLTGELVINECFNNRSGRFYGTINPESRGNLGEFDRE